MSIDAVTLSILALLAAVCWRPGKVMTRRVPICFAAGIGTFFFIRGLARTYLQYRVWSAAPPGTFFLPPHQPLRYFINYSLIHFFSSFLLVLVSAGAVGLLLLLAARFRPSILEPGEIALYLACAFLVQWPLVVPYTMTIFAFHALRLMSRKLIMKDELGIGIAPAILLGAIPFLVIGPYLIEVLRLQALVMPR